MDQIQYHGIDRMRQKSDKIIIGNLCIENTIDVVINRILLSRIAAATDLVGEMEPIIAQGLAKINELIITKEFTEAELEKREWLLVENNLRDIWYYSRIKRYL